MKSSPINALQVECVDPPLNIRRQYLADRFLSKAFQNSSHPLLDKLHKLSQLTSTSAYWRHKDLPCLLISYLKITQLPCPIVQCRLNPLFSTPYEALTFSPNIILNFPIDKGSSLANTQFNQHINEHYRDWMLIFTDASRLSVDGCVGAAVWIPRVNVILNFKLPPHSSVFTGEALAIFEAISFIESHDLSKSLILSDSRSVLEGISANQFRSKSRFPLILKIRQLLLRCRVRSIHVVLAWIPGHSGITGNESVDAYAKAAITSGGLSQYQLYCQDLIPLAKSQLSSKWNTLWDGSSTIKGKHYHDIQSSVPVRPWFFRYSQCSKPICSTICRVRLGHCCSPVFLAKIRVKDHSLCECGLDEGQSTPVNM
ncbi:uncharacterized protein LOC121727469 [Aricia agestis]|uniref:uncharacterized protein LOC121727469 n=1 Tax=Aricia agestis TaxID=91739 RepID=UPI001C20A3FE|nr:uncharacterized protein LOC121727469 [Aricia agestis]